MGSEKSKDQAKDAGLAMVLILLLIILLGGKQFLLFPAIICLVLVMAIPVVFIPWARVWFGLSHVLGAVVSKVLLSLVFFAMVVPVGVFRRIGGADPMCTKIWKKGKSTESVFVDRFHTMTKKDIERPY